MLPLVFPIVVYNGGKPYRHTTDIFKLFKQHEQLARKIFLSPFLLLDLAQISDKDLQGKEGASILTMFLKHVADKKDTLPWLEDILPEIRLALETAKQGDDINSLMRSAFAYLCSAGNANNPKKAIKLICEQLQPKIQEENVMRIADYLKGIGRQEGRHEGRQEGRQEGKQETQAIIARRLIKANILSVEEVVDMTGLSVSAVRALEAQEKEVIH